MGGILYRNLTLLILNFTPLHISLRWKSKHFFDEDNDLIFSVLNSDGQETQTMVLTVKSLPVDVEENGVPAGKLFHADGREVTMADSGSPTITQFVSGGTFSS